MTENEGWLPPQPGSGRSAIFNDGDKIIVEVMGQEFHLDPVQAMSLAGNVIATLEVYFRNKK